MDRKEEIEGKSIFIRNFFCIPFIVSTDHELKFVFEGIETTACATDTQLE